MECKQVLDPLRRVVCYGDSLTEGYTWVKGQLAFTPYPLMLKEASLGKLDGVPGYGVSGERTTHILQRIRQDLGVASNAGDSSDSSVINDENSDDASVHRGNNVLEVAAAGSSKAPHKSILPGDVVVILAGSNDVGNTISPDTIMSNIKRMVETILQGVDPPGPSMLVLCTVPPLSQQNEVVASIQKNVAGPRASLNSCIMTYVETENCRGRANGERTSPTATPTFRCCDVFSEMSLFASLDGQGEGDDASAARTVRVLAPHFAADHIHFNEAGYQHLAACLARVILEE